MLSWIDGGIRRLIQGHDSHSVSWRLRGKTGNNGAGGEEG
ncbi:hypothetical protein PAMC26577_03110 [Caballeronia sordidicola]|uniref:Uncharacterized protein n=1 Tax=Caballeronia sordidicola TaxID=196367 RepID=A0A242N4I6_CABSO|nr:hypothetical protein PAMC26577_03110 [Caballeronia sordidicola]